MRSAFLLVALLIGLGQPGVAQDQPKGKVGFAVGDTPPFMVVTFVAGPSKRGGCPFVMISNSRRRGLVIFARGEGLAAAFDLGKALDGKVVDAKEFHGFLIADDTADDKLAAFAKDAGIEKFRVGRESSVFPKSGTADLVVLLIEGKEVKGHLAYLVSKQYKDGRAALLAEVEKFARPVPK